MNIRKPRYFLRSIQLGSLSLFAIALYVGFQLTRPLDFAPDNAYILEPGQSVYDLAKMLKSSTYIDSISLVTWTARIGNFERSLKAGEYRFEPHFSLLDVFNHIVRGESIQYPLQLIEGWTFEKFLEEIRSKSNINQTLSSTLPHDVLRELEITETHPEGWFFPDTYFFNSGHSDAMILRNAHNAMRQHLEQAWRERKPDLPYKTAYECLIAASIIQKESAVDSEYPIIAGVIVNRLRRGMRLQMDPTVIYGLEKFDGTIRQSHLKTDTPYNTYTRHGLPPTPIAMPGLLALKAAARPADTSALYFVSQGDGTHKFSDTLEEHLKAVRQYREKLKSKSG